MMIADLWHGNADRGMLITEPVSFFGGRKLNFEFMPFIRVLLGGAAGNSNPPCQNSAG